MSHKSILIVVTSHAQMGDTGKPTGLWVEELAVPYYQFVDAGMHVEISAPLGGVAPLEPNSLKPTGQNDPVVERFMADPEAQHKITNMKALSTLDMAAFDALFLPGGHGTMWDLPLDASVKATVEKAVATGKVLAAVCHGPAGLVAARRPDGESIVHGKRVTAFSNSEEDAVGLSGVVPFMLESRLRELGAEFSSGPDWQPFAVRDGLLVTGQNPASSLLVGQHVLSALEGQN
jgi:putative intracellular protease/amidase